MTEYTSSQRETQPIEVDLHTGPIIDIPKSNDAIDSYDVGTARADVSAIMAYGSAAMQEVAQETEPVLLAQAKLREISQARSDALAA